MGTPVMGDRERRKKVHGAREGGGRKQEEMEEKHVHSLLTESFLLFCVVSQSRSIKIKPGTVGAMSCLLCG